MNQDNHFNLIRLVAAMQVLLVHGINHLELNNDYNQWIKISPGVPLFYFISGYLIYKSYNRLREKGLRTFYYNRFLRIYPALWICLVATVATIWLIGYRDAAWLYDKNFFFWGVAQATVFQFYNLEAFRQFGTGVANGALWTISVELQFYIVVPFIWKLLNFKKNWFWLLFIFSVVLNLYLKYFSSSNNLTTKLLHVSILPWLYMFLTGIVVAKYENLKKYIDKLSLIALIACFLITQNFVGNYKYNASNSINPISFALLVVIVYKLAYYRSGYLNNATKFIKQNDFSYGIYLYHMPIINTILWYRMNEYNSLMSLLLMFVVSVVIAIISWFLIERPVLRLKQ